MKPAASGEVTGSMKTANVEKLELQEVCSSTTLGNSPVSVGSSLFLPNLLQITLLSGQELNEIAFNSIYVLDFLPSATIIEVGCGKI